MKKHLSLTFALVAILFACVAVPRTSAQSGPDSALPSGDWSFSAHPFTGTGYEQRPVMVTATISDLTGMVTGVMLKNNSPLVVSAVKFEWLLMTDQNRFPILSRGQTSFIAPCEEIAPGKYRQLNFPIVSFPRISKPLVRKGILSGDYRIEVAVSEVQYADGTTWVAGRERHKNPMVKATYTPRNPQCP